MRQFFAFELEKMSKDIQSKIIKEVETLTKDKLWKENEWIADYRRLRVVAVQAVRTRSRENSTAR